MRAIATTETAVCEVATYAHACGQQWIGYWGWGDTAQLIWALSAGTQRTWHIGHMDSNTRLKGENHAPLKTFLSDRPRWPENKPQMTDETAAIAQLQQLLTSAVASRITDLPSDKPVGVLLSGGLDSSLVAALLVRAGVKVRAYTLDLGEYGLSEVPYAEQVAKFLGISLVKVAATPERIKQAMVPAIQALDMPFGDSVCVPLYLLKQRASQDVSVIFNGEGGDQLFAGWTNKPLIAAKLYQEVHPAAEQTLVSQYMQTFHRLWGYERQAFQPEIADRVQAIRPEDWVAPALGEAHTSAFMHQMRRASVALKGAQNIHLRATNIGFACGLNVRSPFCDLPLALWTFGISGELFLKGSCEKYILKRAAFDWPTFGKAISDRLKKVPDIELVIEPGRAAIAGCATLLTTVVSTKWQGDKQIVGVDTTVANLSVPSVHGGYRTVETLINSSQQGAAANAHKHYATDVCGNTTYSRDYLAKGCLLPKLQPGDVLKVLDVGAYGYAMSSHFLHRPRPAEVLVEGERHRLIRHRESYQILIENQIFEKQA